MLVFVVPILGLVISAGASIGGPAAFWRQWLRWCEATGGCRCVQLYSLVQLTCTVTRVVECTHFSSHLRELLLGGHPVSLDI